MSTKNYIELHRKTKGIVLYDGPCKLCNDAVYFLLKRDAQAYFLFGSLQSKVAQNFLKEKGIDTSKTDSLVFVTATDVWMRSNAVLHICAALKGAWSWFGIFRYIPESVRDSLYDFIAKNRYRWFGKSDSCPSPNPLFKERFIDC
jgi:predicted DCC family thiol-disulfide oxidoreductase YuxK